MTLYEISGEYSALTAMLDTAESDDEIAEIWQKMDAVDASFAEKVDAYARILKNKQAEVYGLKAEKLRLAQRQKAAENAVENLKARMLGAMQTMGVSETATSIGKWRVRQSYSVSVTDEAAVPAEFRIPQPDKIDRAGMLSRFWETGEAFDGAEIVQSASVNFR